MKSKTVKELKEKIEAEVKEDFDFEQLLFTKYPSLFYTTEDGELLPQMQRCWNDCPKGWEPIVDLLCRSIVNYNENTFRSVPNPDKKIMRLLQKVWEPIKTKINRQFDPYKGTFIIRKFASPTSAQQQKIDKKFSMKVRNLTSRVSRFFYKQELYITQRPPAVKIVQYKEKFGTLRFYTDGGDETVNGMIRLAEYLSSMTCQYTGKEGSLVRKGGWWATLSPQETERLGYSAKKEQ